MGLLISWLTVAAGLWIADKLIPDFEVTGDWKSYAIVSAILGLLQFFLGWLLFLVLGVVSLGLGFLFAFVTRLIVSAIVLRIADALSSRLTIRGFVPAVLGAVVLAVTGGVVDLLRR
ncbi:MAG TPA: phage holin family protein [Polyangiaceae bacterium]|jgi:putative membrane protein|nr:phage holin family protein [Polyangiaceae bacterium]